MTKIRFRINYEVQLKRKLEQFLSRYSQEIGYDFQELEIKKYWKEEKQFQANFIIASDLKLKEEMVYEILLLANKLCSSGSGNWSIIGPYENDHFSFECILNNKNEGQPLKWAHIELESEI